ncbi:PREDICTED: gastric triacylglycerol lipase-like [Chrysochloris asiatica]|uniref:Lipase n=1 Tax=Chrysochloris asiatica TaxID=185453 RepID=A0A9B0WG27_CHRAS|nr:PREDICTED: gastric triacylglycerol lipase-like [Chrysochloris asiatica]
MNVSQIISYWGYPNEEYQVVTEDGFILGINRIPHGKKNSNSSAPRPVVFLQHGLLTSASGWISNLPNNSLAFILADAGYDVWMGNNRGNIFSRKHLYLPPDSKEFWEFSFDEMAKYDLPASINFIVKKSGQEHIHYVGHSQGTLSAFIAFSSIPELAQKIKNFFALAPVIYMKYINRLASLILRISSKLYKIIFGKQEVLPQTIFNRIAGTTLCNHYIMDIICSKINFALFGFDPQSLNLSCTDVYLSQSPAGSSLQNILHYIQAIRDVRKVLRAYDYGNHTQNMKHSEQPIPPQYSMKTLNVRTAVWYGLQDNLADPLDVQFLLPDIPNLIYVKSLPLYNHIDFLFGCKAPWDIYYEIIDIIRNNP